MFYSFDLNTFKCVLYRLNYIREKMPNTLLMSIYLNYRVIVGAPQADTSRVQRNVTRGGAVYRCQITSDNKCQVIPFDEHGKCLKLFVYLNFRLYSGLNRFDFKINKYYNVKCTLEKGPR